jgi:hypothetical protein
MFGGFPIFILSTAAMVEHPIDSAAKCQPYVSEYFILKITKSTKNNTQTI